MLATFIAEISLAVYVVWRYKLTTLSRLIVLTLLALATFQLAEYFVCGGMGMTSAGWARVGYAAISMLPPLGLHILHVLGGRSGRRLVLFAYTTMVGFIVYFLWLPHAFRGYQCTGNYVIFQLGARASIMYGYYYYGWLLAAVSLAVRWLAAMHTGTGEVRRRRNNIRALVAGYFVFLIPTGVANSINPDTRRGIPSIMCGFAVLFAVILVVYILPRAANLAPRHST